MMQALEVLVLGCPNEISPYVPQIIDRALELVKYDPVGYASLNVCDLLIWLRIM